MFFQGQRFNKKGLFFLCQHNTRIKSVSSSKNWRWNYLEWTKPKRVCLWKICFSSLFYAQYFDGQNIIKKKKKAVKSIQIFFISNWIIFIFFSFSFLFSFVFDLPFSPHHVMSCHVSSLPLPSISTSRNHTFRYYVLCFHFFHFHSLA